MTVEPGAGFRVVDRRALADDADAPSRLPPGYRAHSALLGFHGEPQARAFLRDKGAHADSVDALMHEWERSRSRIAGLPPLAAAAPTLPVEEAAAIAEITRVMARPDCASAFPDGSWSAALVDIVALVAVRPSLDVAYAETLGDARLDRSASMAAVQLCFAEKHASPFEVGVDHSQKSITVSGIHPDVEVVGLRCGQQGEDGPLIVSFMISAPPPVVVVLRHAGCHFLAQGYHRVYRLMQAGFSRVPCIVRDAPSIAAIAAASAHAFPEPVLLAPRPPLFVDFADPALGLIAPLRAVRRVVRLRPDEYFVAS